MISLARRRGVLKILSYRRHFIANHSSTNYLFYSPKPLAKEVRAVISKLSSHVDVRAHTAEITYNGEFAGLGEELMEGLAELAIDIRGELYAGRMDALKVTAAYCRDNKAPDNQGLSAAAETMRAILEPI